MTYIIEIEDLHKEASESADDLVLVDLRMEKNRDKIEGAVEIDVKESIAGEMDFFKRPEEIAKTLGDLGIDEKSRLVFIDDGNNRNSAKVLFAIYQLGHKGKLSILQGGYPSWQENPIRMKPQEVIRKRTYQPEPIESAMVTYETIKQELADASVSLIDSRSYKRYKGDEEPKYKKAGHIPGAVNYHAKEIFDEAGRWLDKESLKDNFKNLEAKDRVIVSCGSGGSACLNAIALLEAGYEDVALYAGGYSEWLDKGEAVEIVEDNVDKKE